MSRSRSAAAYGALLVIPRRSWSRWRRAATHRAGTRPSARCCVLHEPTLRGRHPGRGRRSGTSGYFRAASGTVANSRGALNPRGVFCPTAAYREGDQGAGIKTARYGSGEREYDFFCAWALFKSADGKPDSLGAQIKFVVKKKKIVNFRPVDEDWHSAGFETAAVGVESVTGLTITNAEIDAAIARDAQYY